MLWDTSLLLQKDVLIGYSNANGTFANAHLESPFTSEESRYRPDQLVGNTGLQGRWIYRLEDNNVTTINQKGLCLSWYREQPDHTTWSRTLGTCPCGFDQGRNDNQYGRGESPNAAAGRTRAASSSAASNNANLRRLDPALLEAISQLEGNIDLMKLNKYVT